MATKKTRATRPGQASGATARPPAPRYRGSPEHKKHPGPWGSAQWHPRKPEIRACPTDIRSHAVPQQWLEDALALANRWCWLPHEDDLPGEPPRYLVWYVRDRDVFFKARRTQLPGPGGQAAEYKGFPAYDWEIPPRMADEFLKRKVISDEVHLRLRRARRAEGQKR